MLFFAHAKSKKESDNPIHPVPSDYINRKKEEREDERGRELAKSFSFNKIVFFWTKVFFKDNQEVTEKNLAAEFRSTEQQSSVSSISGT